MTGASMSVGPAQARTERLARDEARFALMVCLRSIVLLAVGNAAWVTLAFRDDGAIGVLTALTFLAMLLVVAASGVLVVGGPLAMVAARTSRGARLRVAVGTFVVAGAVAGALIGLAFAPGLVGLTAGEGAAAAGLARWWAEAACSRRSRRRARGRRGAQNPTDEQVEDALIDSS